MTTMKNAIKNDLQGLLDWNGDSIMAEVADYMKRFRQIEFTNDINILIQAVDAEFGNPASDSIGRDFLDCMEEVQGVLERYNVRPVQDVGWDGMIDLTLFTMGAGKFPKGAWAR